MRPRRSRGNSIKPAMTISSSDGVFGHPAGFLARDVDLIQGADALFAATSARTTREN